MPWMMDLDKSYSFMGAALFMGKPVGEDGDVDHVIGLTIERVKEGQRLENPALMGRDAIAFLQAAMDAAWVAGLRPAQAAAPTSELVRIEQHLEDMRHIAFSALKMAPGPGLKKEKT